MKLLTVLFTVILIFAFHIPTGLSDETVWELAQSEKYREKFGGMLGRGMVNLLTSPVDLFVQTVEENKKGPKGGGAIRGFGKGLACGTLRLTSGAFDLLTFWVPEFNGFPVAKSYKNCLEGKCTSTEKTVLVETGEKA